jgi:hypothetical protein
MPMHPDLEVLVSLDEQLQARLRSIEHDLRERLETLRGEAARRHESERAARGQALEHEVQAIVEEADADLARRRSQRRAHLEAKEAAAAVRFERAVELYLNVLVPPHDDSEPT